MDRNENGGRAMEVPYGCGKTRTFGKLSGTSFRDKANQWQFIRRTRCSVPLLYSRGSQRQHQRPKAATAALSQQWLHDIPGHIRQPEITSLEAISQTRMIETEKLQHGRVQIMHMHLVFHHIEAQLIALAECHA